VRGEIAMSWQTILKSLNPALFLYVRGSLSLANFIEQAETTRKQGRDGVSQYNSIVNSLKLYQNDKKNYVKEKNFEKFPDARQKLDELVENFDMRINRPPPQTPTELIEAFKQVKSNPSQEFLQNFKEIYEKNKKFGKRNQEMTALYRRITENPSYVIVNFENLDKINLKSPTVKDFIKFSGGELVGDEIHYKNMKEISQWISKFNEFSKENPTKEIKLGRPRPTIGLESETLPEIKNYKVEDLTIQDLRIYLDLINKQKVTNKRFLPLAGQDFGGVPLGKGIANLFSTTKTGENFKINPFINVLLYQDISGSRWFSNLISLTRVGEIITEGQLKTMIRADLREAFKENLEKTKLFGIEVNFDEIDLIEQIDRMDLEPYMMQSMDKIEESYPISNDTKEILEWVDKNYSKIFEEEEWEQFKNLDFNEYIIDGYYTIFENGEELRAEEVSKILNSAKTVLEQARKKKIQGLSSIEFYQLDKAILSLGVDSVIGNMSKITDLEKLFLVQRVKKTKISGKEEQTFYTKDKKTGIIETVLRPNPLRDIIKNHQIGNKRLSSFSDEDIIKLFWELDNRFGEKKIDAYYDMLDDADKRERKRIVREVNTYLQNLFENVPIAIAKIFQLRLNTLLNNGVVADSEANRPNNIEKLPQKLFNQLLDRGIIREA